MIFAPMKTRRKCGLEKCIDDFYAMVGMRDGHRNECKRYNLDAKARRYRANPEPARRSYLKRELVKARVRMLVG